MIEQADYTGMQPSPLDGSLAARLPVRAGFSQGTLLRANQQLYFFDQSSLVRVTGGLSGETAVLDIPTEVVAVYPQRSELEQTQVRLSADTAAANVRQSPICRPRCWGRCKIRRTWWPGPHRRWKLAANYLPGSAGLAGRRFGRAVGRAEPAARSQPGCGSGNRSAGSRTGGGGGRTDPHASTPTAALLHRCADPGLW
ncbi:MAG: hypothetical protein HC875_28810 [Anaerolineales bacterium]|nr:hypothetical protein [Anaerolineales bacterium]